MTDSLTASGDVQTAVTAQVYDIFIQATPEAIFEAITRPEFTQRYFYRAQF
jgi:uncharacterized protein YndB with AHSA1/START domain